MRTLRVILWDQLSCDISCLTNIDKNKDIILLAELKDECTYVKHHKKKLVFLLSAMRHFREELISKGYSVCYIYLDDPKNTGFLLTEVQRAIEHYQAERACITWPSDYRTLEVIQHLQKIAPIEIELKEDDRYLSNQKEFSAWAQDMKELRMEFFYRMMRKKYHILMDGDKPVGGQWNYDAENRKFPKNKIAFPQSYHAVEDQITKDVIHLVDHHFNDHYGELNFFIFGVTRIQAQEALTLFIENRLIFFGDYQDAMIENEAWMYHSHLSFYLNAGLLNPLECIEAAEKSYRENKAPLNAVEGFIRQILGWREYVRGVYWLKMPNYKMMNFFNAQRALPNFFWDSQTKMNCLKQCLKETQQHAYAHHIQRLMVLGNFSLLAGLHPAEVNEWYLIVYADAHEWVELPNVSGMILFADGGYLASKPYAASGAYINKMSDYCKKCVYNVEEKVGPSACPFNYLYWNFFIQHQAQLKHNHRLKMIYATLNKMSEDKINKIQSDAHIFLEQLNDDYNKE